MKQSNAPRKAFVDGTIDEAIIQRLNEKAQAAFKQNLVSILLFGSAAEGRLRPTSDLNLLFVLRRFESSQADAFRESFRLALAIARASIMFVLEAELTKAAEAFAVKFDDIRRRHRVIYGSNPLLDLVPTRQARIQRLQQIIINTTLRIREKYVSLLEEQLPLSIADVAGPLRAAAAALLELEGKDVTSAREALETLTSEIGSPDLAVAVSRISTARESRSLPVGEAGPTVFQILELLDAMSHRASTLTD